MFEDMFEDFIFGFNFETGEDDKDNDGKIYVRNTHEFLMLANMLPVEELGLSFCGEVEIGEGVSILTDKQIKMGSADEAIKTYQKVIEVRELTELEQEAANKFRLFFRKLFEVFFRNEKWRVFYTAFCSVMLGLDIATDNYFGIALMSACIMLYNSPVKFYKELKKMIGSKKRLEKLEEELSNMNVLGYVNSVDNDEEIQLYLKPNASNMP